MKNFFILFLFLSVSILPQEATYKSTLFGKGANLVYTVFEDGEPAYTFLVKITVLSDYIVFDYGFNYSGPNAKGRLIIESSTLKEANGLKNYFGNGYDELNENITSVFFSQKMFNEILSNGKTLISLDENPPIEFKGNASEEDIFIFGTTLMRDYDENDAKYLLIEDVGYTYVEGLKSTIIKNEETGHEIIFWNNPDCPIILYMNLGFEIRLDAIL